MGMEADSVIHCPFISTIEMVSEQHSPLFSERKFTRTVLADCIGSRCAMWAPDGKKDSNLGSCARGGRLSQKFEDPSAYRE